MNRNFWKLHWYERGITYKSLDTNLAVQRTRGGIPISQKSFDEIMSYVSTVLKLKKNDSVLELFCGNGVMTIPLSKICKSIVAVDFSKSLLETLLEQKPVNVEIILGDVLNLDLPLKKFDKVLAYAGIQYLTEPEMAMLIKQVHRFLVPGGTLFIGDIPDSAKKWEFFTTPAREREYFEGLTSNSDSIGTWYDKKWLIKLLENFGFNCVEILTQPKTQINSHYRFDVAAKKVESLD
jgi:ubiquinone/menaquinone biosynthesis C-methylase UbiE